LKYNIINLCKKMYISEDFIIYNILIIILLLLSYIILKIIIMIKNFIGRFISEISIFVIFMYIYKDLLFT